MKRFGFLVIAALLGIRTSFASDTTGALVVFPIVGGLLGLVVGCIVCFTVRAARKAKRAIWFSLPLYGVIGFAVGLLGLNRTVSKYQDKTVASFGRYNSMGGGMGVIPVPSGFSALDLERFYNLLTNGNNTVLASHEFAAALVNQANGISQVYLNVYPSIEDPKEYTVMNEEARRQMDIVLKGRSTASDLPKNSP